MICHCGGPPHPYDPSGCGAGRGDNGVFIINDAPTERVYTIQQILDDKIQLKEEVAHLSHIRGLLGASVVFQWQSEQEARADAKNQRTIVGSLDRAIVKLTVKADADRTKLLKYRRAHHATAAALTEAKRVAVLSAKYITDLEAAAQAIADGYGSQNIIGTTLDTAVDLAKRAGASARYSHEISCRDVEGGEHVATVRQAAWIAWCNEDDNRRYGSISGDAFRAGFGSAVVLTPADAGA